MYKYSGIFMIITGIIHIVFASAVLVVEWASLTAGGIFNVSSLQARGFVWLVVTGILVIMVGVLMQRYIKRTKAPVPRAAGIILAVLTVFLLIVQPISGVWLFVPQVFILLLAPGYKKEQANA
jgi:uncharacterized membrane protein HdeD (DUF308 family)